MLDRLRRYLRARAARRALDRASARAFRRDIRGGYLTDLLALGRGRP